MEITITEYHADSLNADFEPTLFVGFIADLWGHDDDDLSITPIPKRGETLWTQ